MKTITAKNSGTYINYVNYTNTSAIQDDAVTSAKTDSTSAVLKNQTIIIPSSTAKSNNPPADSSK